MRGQLGGNKGVKNCGERKWGKLPYNRNDRPAQTCPGSFNPDWIVNNLLCLKIKAGSPFSILLLQSLC